MSTSLLLSLLIHLPPSLSAAVSSALPPLATDTTTTNVTRLPPTDRIITHGFNCSSLLSNPSPSYYIGSELATNTSSPTPQQPFPLNARQSCLRAAESVCSSFSATKSWTQATHGDCWVGIYNPPSAILIPSSERCFNNIFAPMIDTCINQTSAPLIPASPENATLVKPYDEASYNYNARDESDGNYPTYLVMSTEDFRNVSPSLNLTLPGVLPDRRGVGASTATTTTGGGRGEIAPGPIDFGLAGCDRGDVRPTGVCTILFPAASGLSDDPVVGDDEGSASCVNSGSGTCG